MPTLWPKDPIALWRPYVREIGPFLFPCVLITGYLMGKATLFGLRENKKKEALTSSGHH